MCEQQLHRHQVPAIPGTVAASVWASADPELSQSLAVGVMEAIETGNVEVAKANKYDYVVTFNVNPVPQVRQKLSIVMFLRHIFLVFLVGRTDYGCQSRAH